MGDVLSEQAVGRPAVRLRPFVGEYVGYRLAGLQPGVHAGLPSRSLTLIIAFDEPLDVTGAAAGHDRFWGMLAGLHATPAAVRHGGAMHGVQLSLTPLGVRTLLGVPCASLVSAHVHLEDIAPAVEHELVDRLAAAPSWLARWAVLDDVLGRAIDDTAMIAIPLAAAWSMLSASDGNLKIDEIAVEVGWSRRTLGQRFRSEFGLSPKLAARIMRFERAQRLLRSPLRPDIAGVAASCGYADQSHMTRDWNEFAGDPPTAWLAAEDVTILQDPVGAMAQS